MSVLVVLTMTAHHRRINDLLQVLESMTSEAEAHGVLRQEIARDGDDSALVVSLWRDRSTYEAFAQGPNHEHIARRVRAVGRGTSLTVAQVHARTDVAPDLPASTAPEEHPS